MHTHVFLLTSRYTCHSASVIKSQMLHEVKLLAFPPFKDMEIQPCQLLVLQVWKLQIVTSGSALCDGWQWRSSPPACGSPHTHPASIYRHGHCCYTAKNEGLHARTGDLLFVPQGSSDTGWSVKHPKWPTCGPPHGRAICHLPLPPILVSVNGKLEIFCWDLSVLMALKSII